MTPWRLSLMWGLLGAWPACWAGQAQAPEKAYPLPLLTASTAPLTVPLVIERLERLDSDLRALSCDFQQFVHWDESGTAQMVEGHLDYRKPQLLRIEHRLPEPQTLVSDGQFLWVYRPSTGQVIKSLLSQWKKSQPLAQGLLHFGNYASLLSSYDAEISTQSAPDVEGHRQFSLLLRPKPGSAEARFTLTLRLGTRDFFPTDTELRAAAVSVRSRFLNISYNPTLPQERFHFSPPPDADIFENLSPHEGQ